MSEVSEISRLYWASSRRRAQNWLNMGLSDGPGLDFSCDPTVDGLPLDHASIDYINSQHVLEELEVYNVWAALAEFHRVLKPGGVLRLGLIDLDKAIEAYKNGRCDYFWCQNWSSLDGNFITQ